MNDRPDATHELVSWSDAIACHRDEIDDDHRQLVSLINRLELAHRQQASPEQISQVLGQLRNYTRDHFGRELRLMQQWPVSEQHRGAHIAAHASFVRCLDRARDLMRRQVDDVVPSLLAFLVDWLVHHIQGVDRELVEEIARLERGERPNAGADSAQALRQHTCKISQLYESIGQRSFDLLEANRGLAHEVERRRRIESALRLSEARFSTLYHRAPVALVEVDASALWREIRAWPGEPGRGAAALSPQQLRALAACLRIESANDAALQAAGQDTAAEIQRHIGEILGEDAPAVFGGVLDAMRGGSVSSDGEFSVLHPSGVRRQFAFTVFSAVRDEFGAREDLLIVAAIDITERNMALAKLQHAALHDALTGLPNRTLLHDRLGQAIALGRRHGTRAALLNIDLDGFKAVNDTHGHDVGDLLLRAAAQRMAGCVRESDTLARVGGDEFLALLPDVDDRGGAERVARSLDDAMARPFDLAGLSLRIGASVGVAMYPDDGEGALELTRRADEAMYRVKGERRQARGFQAA